MREPSVRLRADQTSASKIDAWLHRRGRAAPAAPEPEPEHERERLPGIDAGAGEPLPMPTRGVTPVPDVDEALRAAWRRKRGLEW